MIRALPQILRLALVVTAFALMHGAAPSEGPIRVTDRPPHNRDAPQLVDVVATPWQLGDHSEALVVRGWLRRAPGGDAHAPAEVIAPFRVALVDAHHGVGQRVKLGPWVDRTVLCSAENSAQLISAVHDHPPAPAVLSAGAALPFEAIIAPFERMHEPRWLVLDRGPTTAHP